MKPHLLFSSSSSSSSYLPIQAGHKTSILPFMFFNETFSIESTEKCDTFFNFEETWSWAWGI